jgi:hypothetical protein
VSMLCGGKRYNHYYHCEDQQEQRESVLHSISPDQSLPGLTDPWHKDQRWNS